MLSKWLSKPKCDHRWPASVRLSAKCGQSTLYLHGRSNVCSGQLSAVRFNPTVLLKQTGSVRERPSVDPSSAASHIFVEFVHDDKCLLTKYRVGRPSLQM